MATKSLQVDVAWRGTQEVTVNGTLPFRSPSVTQIGAAAAFMPLRSSSTSLYYKEATEPWKDSWTQLVVFIVSVVFIFTIAYYLWQVILILHLRKASF